MQNDIASSLTTEQQEICPSQKKISMPINSQTFLQLIKNDIFVDKTELIFEILRTGTSHYFVARPIGWGKTLNFDMLNCFFSLKVNTDNTIDYPSDMWIFSNLKVAMEDEIETDIISHILQRLDALREGIDVEIMNNTIDYLSTTNYPQFQYIIKASTLTLKEKKELINSFIESFSSLFKDLVQEVSEFKETNQSIDKYDSELLEDKINQYINMLKTEHMNTKIIQQKGQIIRTKYSQFLSKFGKHCKHFGQHPTIVITFTKLLNKVWINTLKENVSQLYRKHYYIIYYLEELLKNECKVWRKKIINGQINLFQGYINQTNDNIGDCIYFLSEMMFQMFNRKVVVLIDEYDSLIIESCLKNYNKEVIQIMTQILTDGLNTNKYVCKSLISGVIRVANIFSFSDLNVIDCTVFDSDLSQYYGFLPEEIKDILIKYNKHRKQETQIKYSDLSQWYNGYKINNIIFNPQSVIYFLDDCLLSNKITFKQYWNKTDYPILINSIFEQLADRIDSAKIFNQKLISFRPTLLTLENVTDCTLEQFLTFITHCGYLTIYKKSKQKDQFKIPNKEMQEYFIQDILSIMIKKKFNKQINQNIFDNIAIYMDSTNGDFKNALVDFITWYKPTEQMNQVDFKSIFYSVFNLNYNLGYKPLQEIYQMNLQMGDAIFLPRKQQGYKTAILVEYKQTQSQNEVKQLLEEGIWQILVNRYLSIILNLQNLNQWDSILIRSVVFCHDQISEKWNVDVKEYKYSINQTQSLLDQFSFESKLLNNFQDFCEKSKKKTVRNTFLKQHNFQSLYELLEKQLTL